MSAISSSGVCAFLSGFRIGTALVIHLIAAGCGGAADGMTQEADAGAETGAADGFRPDAVGAPRGDVGPREAGPDAVPLGDSSTDRPLDASSDAPVASPDAPAEAPAAVSSDASTAAQTTDAGSAEGGPTPTPTDPIVQTTFESAGIYWVPLGAAPTKTVEVQYRRAGQAAWRSAIDLWYSGLDPQEKRAEYRGSILHLLPGTTYDLRLTFDRQGAAIVRDTSFTTWPERFPEATQRRSVANQKQTLVIDGVRGHPQSGYIVYEAAPDGGKLDAGGEHDYNIHVTNSSHVIIRGLTLTGARVHGIFVDGATDIVIEGCDISRWGRAEVDSLGRTWGENEADGILLKNAERVVIQRNRLHHPNYGSNKWAEPARVSPSCMNGNSTYHPCGATPLEVINNSPKGQGGHVVRYNAFYSDDARLFKDGIGTKFDDSPHGGFVSDSDIYGNVISHVADDAMEIEGSQQNVRVWGNHLSSYKAGMAMAAVARGPGYVFRNVFGQIGDEQNEAVTFKVESVKHEARLFFLHNTKLPQQTNVTGLNAVGKYAGSVLRNNVLFSLRSPGAGHVFIDDCAGDRACACSHDLDYNLRNAAIRNGGKGGSEDVLLCDPPRMTEAHGIRLMPDGTGPDLASGDGVFHLKPGALGHDAGQVLPNLNSDNERASLNFKGQAPDMGAHEAGGPPMTFGPDAYRGKPWGQP